MPNIDPKFVDTELANNVSVFPVIGLPRSGAGPRPARAAGINPERINLERAQRTAASRAAERAQIDAALLRTEEVNSAWREGRAAGYLLGHDRGWKHGTAWGIFCGAFGVCLLGAIALIGTVSWIGSHASL